MNIFDINLPTTYINPVQNPPILALNTLPNTQISLEELFNNEHFKDKLLIKLAAAKIIDSQFIIDEKLTVSPLPALKQEQMDALSNLLTKSRVFKGREKAFEIKFTLLELFIFIHKKKALI